MTILVTFLLSLILIPAVLSRKSGSEPFIGTEASSTPQSVTLTSYIAVSQEEMMQLAGAIVEARVTTIR